jgi:integrase
MTLSHVFSVAVNEWGWLESNPVRKVVKPKEPRGRIRFLSQEELDRLLTACKGSDNKYLYPIVVIALSAGPRRGNIEKLKWRDVDLIRGLLFLEDTKNDEPQSIPLVGKAKDLLAELYDKRDPEIALVFPWIGDPTRPVPIEKAWQKVMAEAKIDDFRFHDLRHTAASYLAMSGASLLEIAHILGHKSLEMVKRYAHLTDNHTSAIVAKMNEKLLG